MLRGFLITSSQYADMRSASIAVTREIFHKCSHEEIQVTNAWEAVGIGGHQTCWNIGVTKHQKDISILKVTYKDINTLSLSYSNNKLCCFNIYSIDGKLISTIKNTDGNLDISSLASGVYVLEAISDSSTERIRFIKL
jgi:hypothetical protein